MCFLRFFSSAYDYVPQSLAFRKLEHVGFPDSPMAWLSDNSTKKIQCTRLWLSGWVTLKFILDLFHHISATCTLIFLVSYINTLMTLTSVGVRLEANFSNNLSFVLDFSVRYDLSVDLSKFCLFIFPRSAYSANISFISQKFLSTETGNDRLTSPLCKAP